MRALAYTGLALFAVAGLAAIALQTGLAIIGPCGGSPFSVVYFMSFIFGVAVGALCLLSAGVMYSWRHLRRNFEITALYSIGLLANHLCTTL